MDGGLSRRSFLRRSICGAFAVPLLVGCGRGEIKPRVNNTIVIISDTLRRDAVSCYGSSWVQSPNLARFAEKAQIFSDAYVASFPTVPNRNDIFTGTYTFCYKAWSPIDPDVITLQETLGKNGIMTALIADTPHPFSPGYNYQRGFHSWNLIRGQECDPWRLVPRNVTFPCSMNKLREPDTTLTQYLRNTHGHKGEEDCFVAQTMKAAARFLEETRDGRRFFLYVDTFDPHEPWDPPKEYVRLYEPEPYLGEEVIYPRYDKWRSFMTESELSHCWALYAAEASLVDRWIGYLLNKIQDLGLLKDTAILIASDHGFYLGEHGYMGKSVIKDGVYQDLPLWPEVCRIPFILYVPGMPGGKAHTALVQPPDIMPTVLDLMGIDCRQQGKGRSLVSILTGKRESVRELAFCSPTVWTRGRSEPVPSVKTTITDGRNLLIWGPGLDESRAKAKHTTLAVDGKRRTVDVFQTTFEPEFYDLTEDPKCSRNIFSSRQRDADEMRKEFVRFLRSERVPGTFLRDFHRL
ncbi:MAG: sulfatase [Pseudomonadota bacterium]